MLRLAAPLLGALILASNSSAQRQVGELRLEVVDATGAPIAASGELVSHATQTRIRFTAATDAPHVFPALPFGSYHLTVASPSFAPSSALVEIRSQAPQALRITLGVAPIETAVRVTIADTLVNSGATGSVQHVGAETIRDLRTPLPARSLLNLVDQQPGWLLEANGVLHPRGSEYGVQYVIDGLPFFDNRSPAFVPMLDAEEFQSIVVRTGGYPAEYGRQLGGVIEANTVRDGRPGLHGRLTVEGGGFSTGRSAVALQYTRGRDTVGGDADAMRTDRYLDPPVEANHTNRGYGAGGGGRWERDWNDSDRTRFTVRRRRTGFLVPNEQLQEHAGQRQDRTASETLGQGAWSRIISPRLLFDMRGMGREVSATLWSNPLSTPIAPAQRRGFREAYATASLSAHYSGHELKAGGEALFRSIEERFDFRIVAYRIENVRIFDRDLPAAFRYAERAQNREQGAYVQDQFRRGNLTVSAGVRWDHYRLLVDEHALSPRLAASWMFPAAGLAVRASYDRAFQTPAIENLLLASSAAARQLSDESLALPVPPSRGDFFEAGFSKSLFGRARLDGAWFHRRARDFSDDDLLLNTGVSFPISFDSARIRGFEAKLEVLRWGPVSGFVSYTNFNGIGKLPVTGGLFLDHDAGDLLRASGAFPITQDQRNTGRARIRWQILPRLWLAAGAQYGSGLPVETEEELDLDLLRSQYGARVLDRVDLERGRIRPSFSLDLAGGLDLWKRDSRVVRLQANLFNATDRLNVINFSGLFSGTAVASPRWATLRRQAEF